MTIPDIVVCPRCTHTGTPREGRFRIHNQPGADQPCPLSLQLLPPSGETPTAYISRARLVADLAVQIQDSDPNHVWQYLTALPATELQRIAMLALAAIPVDQTLNENMGVGHRTTSRERERVMNNLLRGTLYGVGASLWIWALLAAFITPWYWLLLIVGALLIMGGGCIPRSDESDDHYRSASHGDDFDRITERLTEFRGTWPNEVGGVE